MDEVTKSLLLGTSKAAGARSGEAVDELFDRLGGATPEQRLLLLAGATAIYRTAGYRPREVAATEIATPEQLPACSAGMASLLAEMLAGQRKELLPEALTACARAGRRLPHKLLPAALRVTDGRLRPLLRPIVGERARWLAELNPDWKWVDELDAEAWTSLPADVEQHWHEGTWPERLSIFKRARALDPQRARSWLAEVWSTEKPEQRGALLELLTSGLTADDEPLLEEALRDRSTSVRWTAAGILTQLPSSRLAGRMIERADQVVFFEPLTTPKTLTSKLKAKLHLGIAAKGKLFASPPAELPGDWKQDAVAEKPPDGIGQRAWWLVQIVSLVPPAHWQQRFSLNPEELIRAAEQDEWYAALVEGWSRAAVRFGAYEWMGALFDTLRTWQTSKSVRRELEITRELLAALFAHMPPAEGQQRTEALFDESDDTQVFTWLEALEALPQPWTDALGESYLRRLRKHAARVEAGKNFGIDFWLRSVPLAARALPQAHFAAALAPFKLPDPAEVPPIIKRWQEALFDFAQVIRIRRTIWNEVLQSPDRREP